MLLNFLINFLMVACLGWVAFRKGVEQSLPWLAFFMVLVPNEAKIPLPGLFDLTPQRLVLITVALLYWLMPPGKSSVSRKIATPLTYLIVAHILWSAISTTNSVVFSTSFKRMLSQVFEYYLLYYIITRTALQRETLHKILFAIVAAMGICGFLAYLEVYHSWSVMSLFPQEFVHYGSGPLFESDRGVRARATFPHSILFGAAITMTVPLAIYLQTVLRDRLQRVVVWISIMLMFLALYKTSSRGPWVTLCIGLFVLLFLAKTRTRVYIVVLGLVAFCVVITRPGVWYTLQAIYDSTLDTTTPMGASYEYRFALKDVAEQALAQSPTRALWGYGMGSFASLGLQATFRGRIHQFLSCDSAWIESMVETGYVGLLIIAALLLRAAQFTFMNFVKMARSDRDVFLVLFVDMVMFYLMMASVSLYSWGQTGHMLWILIAISAVYYGKSQLRERLQVGATPHQITETLRLKNEKADVGWRRINARSSNRSS
jgi:O-Antigen ligase